MPQGKTNIRFFTPEQVLVLGHLQRDFYPHHLMKPHDNFEMWAEQGICPWLRRGNGVQGGYDMP